MRIKKPLKYILILYVSAALFPLVSLAGEKMPTPDTYLPTTDEIMKQKASYDDKRDLFKTYHPKDVVPQEAWKWMHFDMEEMKKKTAEILGFTAPELVGKIAPEIKPGKYTYKDLKKYPGLKKLFPPIRINTIKAGELPFVCNLMDFEIEPTRQFHWSLPLCEVTERNLGKTKLDKDGYIVAGSWQGGVPFPNPSGEFLAQQVYYNMEKRSTNYDYCFSITGEGLAFDKNLKIDKYNKYIRKSLKLMGRSFFPPSGWFDMRAESRGEFDTAVTTILEPRSTRGLVMLRLRYDDPYKMNPMLVYLPQLRRIRKMSATDTQDPNGDQTWDDMDFIAQKITPKRYPYKFEITEEREYLLPFSYDAGKAWVDSKNGYAIRDLGLQRRVCFVLQMTQTDPNYVYSKRVYYVDKETFYPAWAEFYDQKGRLYRTWDLAPGFFPEMGQLGPHGTPAWQVDYVDTHSSYQVLVLLPANNSRREFRIENLIRSGK